MHNRKEFIVYPPEYSPGDGYESFKSLGKAKKKAYKLGKGAMIFVGVNKHKAAFQPSFYFSNDYLMEVV